MVKHLAVLFLVCTSLLLAPNSEQGILPSQKDDAQSPADGIALYGNVPVNPLARLFQVLNKTGQSFVTGGFAAYRRFLQYVPGSHPNDTDYGAASETLGNNNPFVQAFAAVFSQNGLINVPLDDFLYILFGGNQPGNLKGNFSLNRNNSNKLVTGVGGNDISFSDAIGDPAFRGLAGEGTKKNRNQKED